uniref:Uncharacterized protein n=1 Tax=Cucumis melo TaxID=3656 RepID=A0A9I9EAV5_CUCME
MKQLAEPVRSEINGRDWSSKSTTFCFSIFLSSVLRRRTSGRRLTSGRRTKHHTSTIPSAALTSRSGDSKAALTLTYSSRHVNLKLGTVKSSRFVVNQARIQIELGEFSLVI